MNKKGFLIDEREKDTFRKICTTLYIITLFALMGMQLYRQFILRQSSQEWDDIALLLTVNVIVLLGSLLYLSGSINPVKIKPGYLIAGYAGFVVVGFLFTMFKYTVILNQELGAAQVFDYLRIVVVISGFLVLILGVFALLGSRNLEKKIE
jgi:hypothetical protein